MSIYDRQEDMRTGRQSAEAVVAECLARISSEDAGPQGINSISRLSPTALDDARDLDAYRTSTGRLRGPLHGVTVVLKDCIETAGLETTFGCSLFRGYTPRVSASVVTRLREAGAIIVGKSTMPDLAMSLFGSSSDTGVTRNPAALGHDPGGSSSGSAAAVAAGLVDVGIGTDNGGSIRVPAAFCGVVGLRTSPGYIKTDGIQPLVPEQDVVGPITRTVADARLVARSLRHGPAEMGSAELSWPKDRGSVRTSSLASLRVGVLRSAFASNNSLAREVSNIVEGSLLLLTERGVEVLDIEIENLATRVAESSLFMLEVPPALDAFLASRPSLHVRSWQELMNRTDLPAGLWPLRSMWVDARGPRRERGALTRARSLRRELRRVLVSAMEKDNLDCLAYPTTREPSPAIQDVANGVVDSFGFPSNALIGSHSGLSSITVPIGRGVSGVPIGCEVLSRSTEMSKLFAVAERLQQLSSPQSV